MHIEPIINKQKYESVAEQIIALIRNNTFTEGSRLPAEAELASMFQLGRSSVREAIKSLQMVGILTSSAGRGTFVSDNALIAIANADLGDLIMDESSLSELIEIRCILEPAAAALAAKRRTEADILEMQKALQSMHDTDDKAKLLLDGHKFHSALLAASKNRAIIQFHDSISLQLLKMRERDFLTREVYLRDVSAHKKILDAIIAQDATQAKKHMLDHLTTDYANYVEN